MRDADDRFYLIDHRCPACAGAVELLFDCPGWLQRQPDGTFQTMVCLGCGNTERLACTACDWWYADPWRRSTDAHYSRPPWFDDWQAAWRAGEDTND